MFTSNMTSCTNALLRAINNRKYIFAITLKLSKERLKAIDDRKKAEQGLFYMLYFRGVAGSKKAL